MAPVVMIFSALWETTAATMRQMAITETEGRTLTSFWVNLPKSLLMTKPSAMGTMTTLTMERNILIGSTETVVLRSR